MYIFTLTAHNTKRFAVFNRISHTYRLHTPGSKHTAKYIKTRQKQQKSRTKQKKEIFLSVFKE